VNIGEGESRIDKASDQDENIPRTIIITASA
jgi:hypothetical protein